jgi:hypothetical protein
MIQSCVFIERRTPTASATEKTTLVRSVLRFVAGVKRPGPRAQNDRVPVESADAAGRCGTLTGSTQLAALFGE